MKNIEALIALSPGQLLAPVNELVKHFADLMLLACVAFGIQKVLISISGYWVGAWWRAASSLSGNETADGYRFILLTGSRPGEAFGLEHEPGLLVENVDLRGKRITFLDIKNRKDHVIPLSMQALEIVSTDAELAVKTFNEVVL